MAINKIDLAKSLGKLAVGITLAETLTVGPTDQPVFAQSGVQECAPLPPGRGAFQYDTCGNIVAYCPGGCVTNSGTEETFYSPPQIIKGGPSEPVMTQPPAVQSDSDCLDRPPWRIMYCGSNQDIPVIKPPVSQKAAMEQAGIFKAQDRAWNAGQLYIRKNGEVFTGPAGKQFYFEGTRQTGTINKDGNYIMGVANPTPANWLRELRDDFRHWLDRNTNDSF